MTPDPSHEAMARAVISDLGLDTRPVVDEPTCRPELRGHPHEHALWCEPDLPPTPTPGDLLIVVGAVLALALVLFGAAAMAVPR